MKTRAGLRRVVLAISAFRSDEAVLRLLARARERGGLDFAAILVVESRASGTLEQKLRAEGWPEIEFVPVDENIGSAGNLALRLRRAARHDADWVYAVNHDGDVDPSRVAQLVAVAEGRPRVGAVYPIRRMGTAGGDYDVTGFSRFRFGARHSRERPHGDVREVHWSSSNGALYSLDVVRDGVVPERDLWMGWEDMVYGWRLAEAGWTQLVALHVEAADDYEFERRAGLWVSQKPAWYSYYYARNLILGARWSKLPAHVRASIAARVVAEFPITLALRADKRARLRCLAHGVVDGVRGATGKWRLP